LAIEEVVEENPNWDMQKSEICKTLCVVLWNEVAYAC
jgi:hypothetical protein